MRTLTLLFILLYNILSIDVVIDTIDYWRVYIMYTRCSLLAAVSSNRRSTTIFQLYKISLPSDAQHVTTRI